MNKLFYIIKLVRKRRSKEFYKSYWHDSEDRYKRGWKESSEEASTYSYREATAKAGHMATSGARLTVEPVPEDETTAA